MADRPGFHYINQTAIPACPGCGQPIMMRLQIKTATIDSSDPANVILHGRCVGVEVSHDCRPKVKRGEESAHRSSRGPKMPGVPGYDPDPGEETTED